MGEYEKFIKLLQYKDYVKRMKYSLNMTSLHLELDDEMIQDSNKFQIDLAIANDPELKEAFDKAAYELMMSKVLNDLNLKPDKDFKPNQKDLLSKTLVDIILTNLFGK